MDDLAKAMKLLDLSEPVLRRLCPPVLRSAYLWVADRIVHRHHVVTTTLRPGWHDVDEVMFEACFALLGRFVNGELGAATIDEAHQYRGYRLHCEGGTDETAIDLWRWYEHDLAAIHQQHEDNPRAFTEKLGYTTIEDIKQQKLVALIAIRSTLWT